MIGIEMEGKTLIQLLNFRVIHAYSCTCFKMVKYIVARTGL